MSSLARLGIAVSCAFFLVAGISTGDLFRNEGLRARLAQELFLGGSLLVPSLYGEAHLTKPPGMSLFIALMSWPGGEVTTLTARLPSVVAGLAAILLVGWTVGRLSGARAGWLAAVMLPISPLWLDRVPSAEIDLVQLAWVTGAILFFFRAWDDAQSGSSGWPWWMLAFACVMGGFFTKWTAPAFFYFTIVPFLAMRGQLYQLRSVPHLTGLLLASLIGSLWLILMVREAGAERVFDTLSREALLRLSPGHHPRPYPWDELVTFPLAFLAGCLPWTFLAIPLFTRNSATKTLTNREQALRELALAWVGVSLVFWTLVPGHRPRHILPAQPAVVLLASLVLNGWLDGRLRCFLPLVKIQPALVAFVVCWLLVKAVWVGVVVPRRLQDRDLRGEGSRLARLVPEEATLRLSRLKDEGLLFYYGRSARRCLGSEEVPERESWWLLTGDESRSLPPSALIVAHLRDGQGQPVVLVRTGAENAGGKNLPWQTASTSSRE
ncbi:MAG: ArnT family glycosyltransferase [Gemmataceae bacterium]